MAAFTIDFERAEIAVRMSWLDAESVEITLLWDVEALRPCLLVALSPGAFWLGCITGPPRALSKREGLEEAAARGWSMPRTAAPPGPNLMSSTQISDALICLGLVRPSLEGPAPLPGARYFLRSLWDQAVSRSTRAILDSLGRCPGDRIMSALGSIPANIAWREVLEDCPAIAPFLPFETSRLDPGALTRLRDLEGGDRPARIKRLGVDLGTIVDTIPPPDPPDGLQVEDYLAMASVALAAAGGNRGRALTLLPADGGAWGPMRWQLQLVGLNSCGQHMAYEALEEQVRTIPRMVKSFEREVLLPCLFKGRPPHLSEARRAALHATAWEILVGEADFRSALEWALDWRDLTDTPTHAALERVIERLCARFPTVAEPEWFPLLPDLDTERFKVKVISGQEALAAEVQGMRQTSLRHVAPLASRLCPVLRIEGTSVLGSAHPLANALLVLRGDRRPTLAWLRGPNGSEPSAEARQAVETYLDHVTRWDTSVMGGADHDSLSERALRSAMRVWPYFMRRRVWDTSELADHPTIRNLRAVLASAW